MHEESDPGSPTRAPSSKRGTEMNKKKRKRSEDLSIHDLQSRQKALFKQLNLHVARIVRLTKSADAASATAKGILCGHSLAKEAEKKLDQMRDKVLEALEHGDEGGQGDAWDDAEAESSEGEEEDADVLDDGPRSVVSEDETMPVMLPEQKTATGRSADTFTGTARGNGVRKNAPAFFTHTRTIDSQAPAHKDPANEQSKGSWTDVLKKMQMSRRGAR